MSERFGIRPGTNGLAVGALAAPVLGLVAGALVFGAVTVLASIAGIALGVVALRQIDRTGEQGRGFAIGGIVLGGLLLVAVVVLFVVFGIVGMPED